MTQGENKRKKAEQRGRMAETIAAWFLRLKFYAILARRVKTPVGEIDLVVKRGSWIVFVEVKMRRDKNAMGDALAQVNTRRIIRAAEFYLAGKPDFSSKNLRFDVIFLAPFTWPSHVKGAFETRF